MAKFFTKMLVATIVGLSFQNNVFATDTLETSRYEQAKVRLSYEGNVGNLLQQLSQRLKVGFIAYDVDMNRNVSIQNQTETTIKSINENIKSQLSDTDVRFEKIGNRLFMVISAKGTSPLLTDEVNQKEQFVGEVVFDNNGSEKDKIATQSSNATVSTVSAVSANAAAVAKATSTESTTAITDAEKTNATTPSVKTNTTNSTVSSKPSSSRLQEIFNIATNKENLTAAKNKKAPQYKISTKERLDLKGIRVTELGTFLIFESKVDASKLKVKGKFEDFAQGENIVAILHQNQAPPSRIEIENSAGKKLLLESYQAPQPKKEKKSSKK